MPLLLTLNTVSMSVTILIKCFFWQFEHLAQYVFTSTKSTGEPKIFWRFRCYKNDVVLIFLLLTSNRFYIIFWYFHCWLWLVNIGFELPPRITVLSLKSCSSPTFTFILFQTHYCYLLELSEILNILNLNFARENFSDVENINNRQTIS